MADTGIRTTIEGRNRVQGIVGAHSVVVENLNIYNSTLPPQPSQDVKEGAIPPCPYPGLAHFRPQDSALFFGRDAAIARLETAVARQPLTALISASGTGKSSIVLAGLAPRLHLRGEWRFSHFRVSSESDGNPFMALARALVPLLGYQSPLDELEAVQKLAVNLESGAVSLPNALGGCRMKDPGKRILLIADQFEESFTLVKDEARRRRFHDTLLAGFPNCAGSRPSYTSLILTLRGDFYGTMLRYRPLSDALQDHVENLAPMTRGELREAIVKPAGMIRFESGLVETLLDAVEKRPGSLPLLQFALREIWERQEKRCITRQSYDAIGGVEKALAQRAQAILDALTKNGKDSEQVRLFRRLFTRLVTLGDGVEDTRRAVDFQELGRDTWALAQRLACESNRLIVISNAVQGRATAEVVHEALIEGWPTLIGWIESDRRFHSWLRQLKPRVEEWHKQPADEGTLLRGGPLAGAEVWLAQRGDELSEDERSYIEASVALREANRQLEDNERQRNEKNWRLRRRFVRAIAAFFIVLLVLSWFHLWVKSNNVAATWEMGLTALHMRTWLLFHKPPEPEMVRIPAGSFSMGSPDNEGDEVEHPQHIVALNAFEMGKYEVTFEQYDVFTSATLRERASDRGWGREKRPAINVSWNDAIAYIEWLNRKTGGNYRLPSEAEWEYAARAGTTTAYWWGNEISNKGSGAYCNGCGSQWDGGQTAPRGSFEPNPWALHDTAGNVWEWVADCWHETYVNAPADGSAWTVANGGDCRSRAVRGGSWTGSPRDRRSAERLRDGADAAASDQGFRLARSLPH
jgi:formylglycine-generating enzyme required for sulfatase activity